MGSFLINYQLIINWRDLILLCDHVSVQNKLPQDIAKDSKLFLYHAVLWSRNPGRPNWAILRVMTMSLCQWYFPSGWAALECSREFAHMADPWQEWLEGFTGAVHQITCLGCSSMIFSRSQPSHMVFQDSQRGCSKRQEAEATSFINWQMFIYTIFCCLKQLKSLLRFKVRWQRPHFLKEEAPKKL